MRYVATIRQIANDFRVWLLDNIDADKTAPKELKENALYFKVCWWLM
ncbi:MAG: hypothetical protein NZ805_15860 [Armatimonadetes bacterium]|nr:hypothetical protein [Armatimonadota bacterium]MDW8028539.1 hypothetical protein [Armatimonadota bacterium]